MSTGPSRNLREYIFCNEKTAYHNEKATEIKQKHRDIIILTSVEDSVHLLTSYSKRIAALRTPKFKAGKALKEAVKG